MVAEVTGVLDIEGLAIEGGINANATKKLVATMTATMTATIFTPGPCLLIKNCTAATTTATIAIKAEILMSRSLLLSKVCVMTSMILIELPSLCVNVDSLRYGTLKIMLK